MADKSNNDNFGFKIKAKLSTIKSEMLDMLESHCNVDANYNSDRMAWIYNNLYNFIESNRLNKATLTSWADLVVKGAINNAELRDSTEKLFPFASSVPKARPVKNALTILFIGLAVKQRVSFGFNKQPKLNIKSGGVISSPLFLALPFSIRFFYLINTPAVYEKSKRYLPDDIRSVIDTHLKDRATGYKTWSGATNAYRRLVLHFGISELSDITAETMYEYRLIEAETGSTRAFHPVCDIVSMITRGDYSLTQDLMSTPEIKTKRYKDIGESGYYFAYTGKMGFDLCGVKDVVVNKRRTKNAALKVEDWSLTRAQVQDYNPEKLPASIQESYWYKTQIEYLEGGGYEKSTKKIKRQRLAFLNAYLFSYLPTFFKRNEVPYSYPDNISDFHGYLFVSMSSVMMKHIFNSNIPKLPVTLIGFINELHATKGNMKKHEISKNNAREVLSELKRYFDFVMARYIAIPECRLASNPITGFDKTLQGSRINTSNKKRFDYLYWILFKEFLYEVANALLTQAEHAETNSNDKYIKVDKTVKFGDAELKIGSVDVSCFTDITLTYGARSIRVKPYQQYTALTLMASSGLRLSNIMWLDVRTYDQYLTDDLKDEDFCRLYVNTDKASTTPFDSSALVASLRLCQRVGKLRSRLVGVPLGEMPYQSYDDSKWGNIEPLFIHRAKNGDTIQSNIASVLEQFEKALDDSGLQYESELFLAPRHLQVKDFLEAKKKSAVINDSPYFVQYETGGAMVPFTSLKLVSEITPHSLRKTLDSFYSVLSHPKTVGEAFTGQTEAVVGYYTENTPEEEVKIKAIAKMSGLDSASLSKVLPIRGFEKNEEIIKDVLIKQGIDGVDGFTLSSLNNNKININEVLQSVSREDIAVNWTHTCPYDNECPSHIKEMLDGKKRCAVCPVAISLKSDAPAIAGKIRKIIDDVKDINEALENSSLINREEEYLIKKRLQFVNDASDWLVRLSYVNKIIGEDDIVAMPDGVHELQKHLRYMEPGTFKHDIISRLVEVEGVASMQSSRLMLLSDRIARKLMSKIGKNEIDVPLTNQADVAIGMIRKIVNTHKIDVDDLLLMIDEFDGEKYLIDSSLSLEAS